MLWVAGSLYVLIELPHTALGAAFVIAQAVIVALLAELDVILLRTRKSDSAAKPSN